MTALRGLREASLLIVAAAAVSVVIALVWVALGGGSFVNHLGVCLIVLGILLSITGDAALSRAATSDTFAWLGQGPETPGVDTGGGRVLTGVGVFLFVALPLLVLGGVLVT